MVQLAGALGLVGVAWGWRGGMRKLYGFYDGPAATQHLMIGLVLGGFLGVMLSWIIRVTSDLTVSLGVFIVSTPLGLSATLGLFYSLVLFLLSRRKRARAVGARSTSGWALGLGIGALIASRLNVDVLTNTPNLGEGVLMAAAIGLCFPWAEALLIAGQWAGRDLGKPVRFFAISWLLRTLLWTWIIFSLVLYLYPLLILLVLPLLAGAQRIADQHWLPSALDPEALRRWKRIRSENARMELAAQ